MTYQPKPVTPQDIRNVIESYGESLTDLGGQNYSVAFLRWFKEKEPEKFEGWVSEARQYLSEGRSKLTDRVIGEELLFVFSNSSLDGRISLEQHDAYLSEFCSANPRANKHLQGLLKGLQESD